MSRGYTLVEMLVVLAMLGALALAAFPLAELTVQRERERELKRALWEIRDSIDAYKRAADQGAGPRLASSSGYPTTLRALVQATPNATNGRAQYFLRRIPRDPFADPALPAEATWGLRSFQSSAELPKPGDDVYDVYSLSTKKGLNGVPLREW